MNNHKAILVSVLLGFLLGFIGVQLTGYLVAVEIPKAYFLWFKENLFVELAMVLLAVVEQFFGFGILALMTGYILVRLTRLNWLKHSIICYFSVLLYFSVGSAIVYDVPISNPFAGISSLNIFPMLILPACLMVSSYIASTKGNKSSK